MIVISLRSVRRRWRSWIVRFLFTIALIYALSRLYAWLIRPLW